VNLPFDRSAPLAHVEHKHTLRSKSAAEDAEDRSTSLFIDVAFGLSPALLGLLAGPAGYPATFLVSSIVAAIGATWLLLPGRAWARSRALPAG